MERFRTGSIVLGLLLVCMILKTGSQEIRVDGDDFLAYNLSRIPWLPRIKKHSLMLDFKTVNPNGLLVYIGSELEQADFLMLDLVRGKLRITVNLGDDLATPTGDLLLEDNLEDNYWHTVKLKLVGRHLNVSLHGQKYHTVLRSKFFRLNINAGFVFAGGVPQHTLDILQRYKPSANLSGCLRDVYFDKQNILADQRKADGKGRVFGSPGKNCRHAHFATLSFQHQKSYLFLPSPTTDRYLLRLKMRFRTYFANGILAVKGLYPYRYVGVSLVEGKMFLQFRLSVRNAVIQISQGEGLNDGEWHDLSAVVGKAEMKLKVDQLLELRHENPILNQTKRFKDLFIGHPDRGPNFLGCIHDLHVDDHIVDLERIPLAYIHGTVYSQCNISSNCFPNPCLHCGTCSEARSGVRAFSCNCQRTFYRGPRCQRPIYLRTCQEYKNLGLAEDAYCKVDSDAEGPARPVKVLCNVTDENQAVSFIDHNKIGSQLVASADVKHEDLVYIHYVKYQDDLEGIKALIAQSDRCRQFVSFRCFETKLHTSVFPVLWGGGGGKTVDDHWPGAPAGSNKCACGVDGTCADPRLPCNCDTGDKIWREDNGYVTDKTNLPVTLLQFPFSAARSYFTVGPLECFGTLNNNSELTREMEVEAARYFNSLCRVANPTTEPLPSTSTPEYTDPEVLTTQKITTPVVTTNYEKLVTMDTKLSSTGKAGNELLTSQPTLTDLNIPSDNPNEVNLHVSEGNTDSESSSTTSSTVVISFSVTPSGTLPLNHTQTPGDSNSDQNSFDQDEPSGTQTAYVMSWQLAMAWALLIVLFVMVVLVVGYIVKKRRGHFECGNLFPVKKKEQQILAEAYGFPEVRLRSRSGELDLSDVHRSIEAGSYNVRSGTIAYGESFYM